MASSGQELPRFPSQQSLPFGTRPALLVIDVCNAYLTPGSPLYAAERFDVALAATERAIELFRSLQLPIIFTKVSLASPAMGGKWFTEKIPNVAPCFLEGSELGQYPKQSHICRFQQGQSKSEFEIAKQYASGFFGTPLASLLSSMGVDTTVIVGFSTSGCVRATSLDAIQHGFRPFVVGEACGDRDENVHSSNLFDIQAKIGEVVSLQQLKGRMKDLDNFSVETGSFQKL